MLFRFEVFCSVAVMSKHFMFVLSSILQTAFNDCNEELEDYEMNEDYGSKYMSCFMKPSLVVMFKIIIAWFGVFPLIPLSTANTLGIRHYPVYVLYQVGAEKKYIEAMATYHTEVIKLNRKRYREMFGTDPPVAFELTPPLNLKGISMINCGIDVKGDSREMSDMSRLLVLMLIATRQDDEEEFLFKTEEYKKARKSFNKALHRHEVVFNEQTTNFRQFGKTLMRTSDIAKRNLLEEKMSKKVSKSQIFELCH